MSKKDRPTTAQVLDLLQQPAFRRPDEGQMPSTDPLSNTVPRLPVEQIDFYEFNPRRAHNDKFAEIKASIAARGQVDHPISVTRRPGNSRYVVYMGGNTRLRAVKELWAETANERFRTIHAVFNPWPGHESDALIGHLRENDQHGYLILVDRARGIRQARKLLEEESGESISPSRLVDLLKERGYSIARSLVIWFDYAMDVLAPAIPQALDAGMGRPQVERLRQLERAFSQVWKSLGLDESIGLGEGGDRVTFQEVLGQFDGPSIDLTGIRQALEQELSVSADQDLGRISLLFGAALDGRSEPVHENLPDCYSVTEELPSPSSCYSVTGEDNSLSTIPDLFPSPTSPSLDGDWSPAPARPAATPAPAPTAGRPAPATPLVEPLEEDPDEEDAPPAPAFTPDLLPAEHLHALDVQLPQDVKSLRARAWTLAAHVGGDNLLTTGIVTPIGSGLGFLVGPISEDTWGMVEGLARGERDLVQQVGYVWWLLGSASLQFTPGSLARDHAPRQWADTAVGRALRAEDFSAWLSRELGSNPGVQRDIPILRLHALGQLGLYRMTDRSWVWYVQLLDTCRRILEVTGNKPWESTARKSGGRG